MKRFLLTLTVAFLVTGSSQAEKIYKPVDLSMRKSVVNQQFNDLQSQRCFESLNKCQDGLYRTLQSLRPQSERELQLYQENEMLRTKVESLTKIVNCLNLSDETKKSECLDSAKQK